MEIATHYTALNVLPSAEPSVIKAAYKALVLAHHPDKTVHLSACERATHASLFRAIQEAWDVLGNPALKTAYDRELARHGNCIDAHTSTFHHHQVHHDAPPRTPCHHRTRTPIRLTTPEEKRAHKAKAEQDLTYLREQRAKRDIEDATMDTVGLRFMLATWTEMAAEFDGEALGDGFLRAYCAVQMQVYRAKIARRERERGEWLEGMARARERTPGSVGLRSVGAEEARETKRNIMPERRGVARGSPAKASPPESPLVTRAEEKARRDAARQAQLDAKTAAVRVDKEKRRAKLEEHARREADRIACLRAKAGAPPLGRWGGVRIDSVHDVRVVDAGEGGSGDRCRAKPVIEKGCARCGVEHAPFAEWRKCHGEGVRDAGERTGVVFFGVV